jgi:hypothetical protein
MTSPLRIGVIAKAINIGAALPAVSKQRRGQELDQDAAGARLASRARKDPKSMKNPVPRR